MNKQSKLKIEETKNYDQLLSFAFQNGVEYDEENNKYINTPYLGLTIMLDEVIIGSVVICKSKYGDYVLENLAVNENFRHKGYATMLIEELFSKLKKMKIVKLYLIAHVYEIYLKNGFNFTDDKSYLITNNCLNCELYKNKECVPRVMIKEL